MLELVIAILLIIVTALITSYFSKPPENDGQYTECHGDKPAPDCVAGCKKGFIIPE